MNIDQDVAFQQIPFRLRGYDGIVTVRYGPNADSERWGYPLLGMPFDPRRAEGYPVIHAAVTYAGEGLHAIMGWVQLSTVQDPDTGQTETTVDQAPIFEGSDYPFFEFGYKPILFDATGDKPASDRESRITHSYLVYCPDIAKSKVIRPILSLRWGFARDKETIALTGLEPGPESEWTLKHRPRLARLYPTWRFLPYADTAQAL